MKIFTKSSLRRLREITLLDNSLSNARISQAILEYIVRKSEKDIRTALNSLQYVSQMKDLSIASLQDTNIGTKDDNSSLFQVWKQFFKLKHIKNYRHLAPKRGKSKDDMKINNLEHALKILNSCSLSEFDKILTGLYENCLYSKKSDSNFTNYLSVSTSTLNFDILAQKIRLNQAFSLCKYQAFQLANYHIKYATGSGLQGRLNYPSIHSDAFKKQKKFTSTRQACKNFDVSVVIPLLSRITEVVGPKRAVAPQMYKEAEKELVAEQIERFVDAGICLNQEKLVEDAITHNSGYKYVMYPEINSLADFHGISENGNIKITGNIHYFLRIKKNSRFEGKFDDFFKIFVCTDTTFGIVSDPQANTL